jgi:hypothetical protein
VLGGGVIATAPHLLLQGLRVGCPFGGTAPIQLEFC